MKYYKNGGFYDKEVHALGLAGGDETKLEETWAAFIADAVEVSDEDWQGLINGQAQGKRIEPDENGLSGRCRAAGKDTRRTQGAGGKSALA